MIRSRVTVTGIPAQGRHGASPGERDEPQEFVVDLDVFLAVKEDSLDATVDYRVLAETARDTVAGTSFELLESLAEAVAKAVYAYQYVERVTAVVHKPRAAASVGADDVSAEATVA